MLLKVAVSAFVVPVVAPGAVPAPVDQFEPFAADHKPSVAPVQVALPAKAGVLNAETEAIATRRRRRWLEEEDFILFFSWGGKWTGLTTSGLLLC